MDNQEIKIQDLITEINRMPGREKNKLAKHVCLFFLANDFNVALKLLQIFSDEDKHAIIRLLLDEVKSEDSISKKEGMKNQVVSFLKFIQMHDPEFYAYLFYLSCFKYRDFVYNRKESYLEYFSQVDFNKEAWNVLLTPWFKVFIKLIINVDRVDIINYIFNPKFNQLIIDRVIPELQSVTTHILTIEKGKSKEKIDIYKSDLERFWYLATLLEYTFKKDDEDYNIFAIEDEMLLTNDGLDSARLAICRIRECAIYFHFVNLRQFAESVPSERIDDLNNFASYYFEDEKGTEKLQNFIWFQQANGIKEIPFPR